MISDPARLGRVARDAESGKLVLMIRETRRWGESDTLPEELRKKLRSYVRYIRSPEFAREYGTEPADVLVRLVSAHAPDARGNEFVARARYELDKLGIGFDFRVGEKPNPAAAVRPTRAPTPRLRRSVQSGLAEVAKRPAAGTRQEALRGGSATTAGVTEASRRYGKLLTVLTLAVIATTLLFGFDYYLTPISERPYHELHELLKPSGNIGLLYGMIGGLFMLMGVGMYSLRKRVRAMARAGKLSYWLRTHIFLCTVGPYLVLMHTSFKVGGLVAIAFWSMVAVVASGFFGRYVYGHIPKTINGSFMTLRAIEGRAAELLERVQTAGLNVDAVRAAIREAVPTRVPRSVVAAFFVSLRYELKWRGVRKRLARRLAVVESSPAARRSILALVGRQVELKKQVAFLRPFQRLFGYWHVLHLPLALVMLLVVCVHVAVAVLFGYAWWG